MKIDSQIHINLRTYYQFTNTTLHNHIFSNLLFYILLNILHCKYSMLKEKKKQKKIRISDLKY